MAWSVVPFYNVEDTVGSGGVNKKTDVMLVQYLIFNIIVSASRTWAAGRKHNWPLLTSGPKGLFPFDGKYDPNLDGWIRLFQKAGPDFGYGPMTQDGKVNRAPVGWGKPIAINNSWYTIQGLNLALYRMNEQAFARLPEAEDVPEPLKKDLEQFAVPNFWRK